MISHFNWEYFLLGIAGWFVQSLFKLKATQDTAKQNKIQFVWWEYYTDIISHLLTFSLIGLAVWLVEEWVPIIPSIQGLVKSFFVAVGISNGMIVSYIMQFIGSKFSVTSRVKDASAYKSQIADDVNGTVEPTP
jgi:hypothetical protein